MIIAEILFGSSLYGTATATSDIDVKTVFVPPVRQILLNRIRIHESNRREKAQGEKNIAGEIDIESFAFHHYLTLLAEGQTLALDMLFAPDWAMQRAPHPVWKELVDNRHLLVSRQAAKFVNYCRDQARKYGIKGSRIHALRMLVAWFDLEINRVGPNARLRDVADTLPDWISSHGIEHTQIIMIKQANGGEAPHLECCDKKAPFTVTLKNAQVIYATALAEYGDRALMAESNEGVDWKACSHAVRIGYEALEFLNTGWITFPRPDAAHLLAIKHGQIPYQDVAQEIESLMDQVVAAQATSNLPDKPNYEYIDNIVCRVYGEAVQKAPPFA
jgi:hypothetical protein